MGFILFSGFVLGLLFTLFFTFMSSFVLHPFLNWVFSEGIKGELNTNMVIFMGVLWMLSSNVITAFIVRYEERRE